MVRLHRTPVHVITSAKPLFVAAAVLAAAVVLMVVLLRPAVATAACDRTASPGTLASKVAKAKPGQTICLKTGDYGTWNGTDKRVTLRRARASRPTMRVNFGPGDGGFTLDGMSGMGGTIDGGARNITIRNSSFAEQLYVEDDRECRARPNAHDWNANSRPAGRTRSSSWTFPARSRRPGSP